MRRIYDVDVLLEQYHSSLKPGPGTLVRLIGLDGRDGYNPSNPVPDGAHPYTYVRVEPRQDEFDSWSVPFRQRAVDRWELDEHLPRLRLQDPSVAVLNGTLVVGGVRIVDQSPRHVIWETVFYRGPRLESLSEFARSPLLMKDVRLIEIEPSIIGVFTRPLGGKAGRGQIGYTEISSIDELTTAVMAEAEMIESQPIAEHWWGANAVYRLDGDNLGVLAHIAKFEGESRHYYPIAFVFDRRTRRIVREPKIIADRSCFPAHAAKRPDLEDVIFPAWLDRKRGLLCGGLSDVAIGVLAIEDPFV
ncbi:MAG TPA: DUF1861 family protein [Chloroflexota bacterium]